MKKIMIGLTAILLTTNATELPKYYDLNPSEITTKDIKIIDHFDDLVYEITERRTKKINIAKIYEFIKRTKKYKHNYNKLKVTVASKIGTAKENSIYIEVAYPLFDKKRQIEEENNKLQYDLNILAKIEEYAKSVQDVEVLREKLEFLRLKQILLKAEVKSGVKYRDERLLLLEKILTTKNDLKKAYEKKEVLKIYLLDLSSDQQNLKDLL